MQVMQKQVFGRLMVTGGMQRRSPCRRPMATWFGRAAEAGGRRTF
jgi:hypothetical protein